MNQLEGRNGSIITEFILLDFGDLQELQILLFVGFLSTYIMTIAGNLLIIVLVVIDHHLHTPMYFFLGNLSSLEICYSSTIVPRMLGSFLTDGHHISVKGCIMQSWAFGFLLASECSLLAAMSYDRYLAVCRPLHYATLMNPKVCFQMMIGCMFGGLVIDMILLAFIMQLNFCGYNKIDHFFCEFVPLVNVACSDAHEVKLLLVILTSIWTLPLFSVTMVSYGCIISAILRISSTIGRQKAFSICSSHLIVVTIFYGTIITVYILQGSKNMKELNKILSVFYTILTPLINPLIYSLRNKEVKEALKRAISKCAVFMTISSAFLKLIL